MKNIPKELLEIILSKLPPKTLNFCILVNKQWYNLITNPKFISSHLNFTNSLKDKTTLFLVHFSVSKDIGFEENYVLFSDVDEIFKKNSLLTAPEGSSAKGLFVRGCCNGLICLSDFVQNAVLWNPLIMRYVHLPKSNIESKEDDKIRILFGFVFDDVSNDYKVLRTVNSDVVGDTVEMFRLSTNLWEPWTKEVPFRKMFGYNQVVLNGVAHWIGTDCNSKLVIVTFDVDKEVFGSLEGPKFFEDDGPCNDFDSPVSLFLFEESLVLVSFTTDFEDGDVYVDDGFGNQRLQTISVPKIRYDFWKMEEYGKGESWNWWDCVSLDQYATPLGFRRNGDFIWGIGDDENYRKLVSMNIETESTTVLGRSEVATVNSCSNYVESLALLGITPTNIWDE